MSTKRFLILKNNLSNDEVNSIKESHRVINEDYTKLVLELNEEEVKLVRNLYRVLEDISEHSSGNV